MGSAMITRKDVPALFEVDDSWRDIYVPGVSAGEWNSLLLLVREECAGSHSFFVDGEASMLPSSIEEIMRIYDDASPHLTIDLGGLVLRCRFSSAVEVIEMDFDPKELSDETLPLLLAWIRRLGLLFARNVLVSPENSVKTPILMFDPGIDRVMTISAVDRDPWDP